MLSLIVIKEALFQGYLYEGLMHRISALGKEFLAKDVATWIGHTHTTKMLSTVDEDEKLNGTIVHAGQQREVLFLTENGLYEVLMQSRKPVAKLESYCISMGVAFRYSPAYQLGSNFIKRKV